MSNYKSINKNNTGDGNNNDNNNNENSNTENNNISSNSYTQKFKQQKKRYKQFAIEKIVFLSFLLSQSYSIVTFNYVNNKPFKI